MQIVSTPSGYYVYRKTKLLGRRRRVGVRFLTKKQAKGVQKREHRKRNVRKKTRRRR